MLPAHTEPKSRSERSSATPWATIAELDAVLGVGGGHLHARNGCAAVRLDVFLIPVFVGRALLRIERILRTPRGTAA
jgi:hypothetical protein